MIQTGKNILNFWLDKHGDVSFVYKQGWGVEKQLYFISNDIWHFFPSF